MLTKLTKITVATLLAVSSGMAPVSHVFAKEASTGEAVATKTGNKLTIGNNAIEREFDLTGNKLSTSVIDNKLGNKKFVPADGSEEFIINLLKDSSGIEFHKPSQALTSVKPSAAEVVVNASSEVNDNGVKVKGNAIDGNPSTFWASNENANGVQNEWFEIDLGTTQEIKTIKYTPRFDASAKNKCVGLIYTMELVFDGDEDSKITKEFTYSDTEQDTKVITLETPKTARKVKIRATRTEHWKDENKNKAMNIAEIDVLGTDGHSFIHQPAAGEWSITGTSNSTNPGDNGGYAALIDGNPSTYYHSRYNDKGEGTTGKMPVKLTLDRGNNTPFQTFGYLPRPHHEIANGAILEYEIYVSDDQDSLFDSSNKKLESKFIYNNGAYEGGHANYMYASFDEVQTGRYVGINVLKGHGGNFVSGAEIDFYAEKFDTFNHADLYPNTAIKTSDLTLAGAPVIEDTTATINNQEKTGVMVTFNFEPLNGVEIAQKVVMYDGDHYMRKFLEVKFEDKQQRIDYIDGEHLVLNDSDDYWTIPHVGGVVQMEEFKANLGQPIYVDGLFLGSEFPATQTEVVNKTGFIRYFTGKNFDDFARDGQLTKDGKYVSWQTVVGASPAADTKGNNLDIVKQSFFEYINSIATPSDFRIQYNSWFDNMMRITDENILSSFSAIDKHLSETGVRPLDSYVVDDGWNIYRGNPNELKSGIDIERNGKDDVNTAGFWQFNSKFPQGLTPSSELVQNFGSNFGVWIGPRGGYNYYGQLADIITKAGNGSKAGGSIDVADQRYVTKFEEMAIQWMRDYGVNYWKWDGFADNAQFNAFPSGEGVVGYDENHHHMYGGPHHMYHVTDLWEKWIDLMSNVRDEAEKLHINNLWISLTCYVNPSPWYLQWANSVWIQCVADRGERTNGNSDLNNKMDAMLSYRDGAYYDFVVNHKFQFPLANLYNHDPIYGTEGTGITANSMNAEQFRNYMFMQGTRGTAFWELYYSDSILDEEKYLINADFLEWAEANFDLLRNAIMIGGTPSSTATLTGGVTGSAGTQEAYGFAGFNLEGTEGTISMRNPAATEKTISFKLDEAIGVKTTKGTTYHVTKDHAYVPANATSTAVIPTTAKQGDTITVTLQPGETYVLHFNTTADKAAPVVNKLYIKDANTVQVQTSKHVKDAAFTVTVDGKEVQATIAKAYGDLRTFDLTLTQPLTNGANVVVTPTAGHDDANNQLAGTVALNYYKDGVVASADEKELKDVKTLSNAKDSIFGKNGFAVTVDVTPKGNDSVFVSQGNDYQIGIDSTGHPFFALNGIRAVSDQVITEGQRMSITGVKENNGIIKLYINGHVDKSAYKLENKTYEVAPAAIVVNNERATLHNVTVYNESLGYDEVPALPIETELRDFITKVESEKTSYTEASWTSSNLDALLASAKESLKQEKDSEYQQAYDSILAAYKTLVPETETKNLALHKPVSAGWVNNDYDGNGTDSGRPLNIAVDGSKNSSNSYNIFGHITGNQTTKPAYMQVDLGNQSSINEISLYRYWQDQRTYSSTAIVVSNTPDFESFDVVYYSGDEDVFGLGQQPTEEVYRETSAGKTITLETPVTGRYVRVYGNGVQGNNRSENHIVELEVFGTVADVYNLAELESSIAAAKEVVKDTKYTESSLQTLREAIANAEEVVKAVKANTQSDKSIGYVLNAKEALANAVANLEVKKADVTVSGLSLSLADNIGVNYYFDFSNKVLADEKAYVEFTREDNTTVKYTMKEIKANQKVVNGKTLYRLSVPMAARQMTDTINGKVVLSDGTEIVLKETSVQSYAKVILDNKGKNYSDESIAVVKAMLNYGASAQVYFQNKTDSLANAILAKEDQVVTVDNSVFDQYVAKKEGTIAGLDYYGTSVLLKSKSAFAHYFTLADGESIDDYTFTVNGKALTPVLKDGKYYVEINDIYAKNLANTYELVVTKGSESMTVTFGVFSYARLVVNGNYSEELKDVVRSMYPYYEAALAYSKTVNTK